MQEAQANIGVDLDSLLDATTKDITFDVAVITDEDGNPVAGFTIVGRNSEQGRAADKAVRVANQKAAANRAKAIDSKTDAGAEKVVGIVEDQNLGRAAAVVVDWFGWTKAGVARPFDKAAVKGILSQKPTWVEKITVALNEDANFLPVLPSKSETTTDNSSN